MTATATKMTTGLAATDRTVQEASDDKQETTDDSKAGDLDRHDDAWGR